MTRAFWELLARDVRLAVREGGAIGTALGFYLMVVAILPLGLGPDLNLLSRIAPGVLWIALLLSALLSADRIFHADHEDGTLEAISLGPLPLELVAVAKACAHWLTTALPLTLLAPLLGLATLNKALVATFAPNAVPRDYAERTRVSLVLRPWQFLANAEDFVDLCNHAATLSPRYGEIARPTAIIMGEFDTLVSRSMHAERCAHEIAGATLCIMKGIGHSPHFADPGAVVAEIVEVDRRAGISSPVEREGEPFKAAKDASL